MQNNPPKKKSWWIGWFMIGFTVGDLLKKKHLQDQELGSDLLEDPHPKQTYSPHGFPKWCIFHWERIKYVKFINLIWGIKLLFPNLSKFTISQILQQSHENPPNFPCSFAVPPWSAQDTAQCTTASGVVGARLVVPFGDARLPCLWDFMGKIVI